MGRGAGRRVVHIWNGLRAGAVVETLGPHTINVGTSEWLVVGAGAVGACFLCVILLPWRRAGLAGELAGGRVCRVLGACAGLSVLAVMVGTYWCAIWLL